MQTNSYIRYLRYILLVFLILVLLATAYFIIDYIKPITDLLKNPDSVRAWAEQYGFLGRLLFVLAMAIQVLLAFIPAGPVEIAAGFAYGAIHGTIISVLGVLLGSAMVFLLVKRFGLSIIKFFFPKAKLNDLRLLQNEKRLYRLTFIIFLIPGMPKDLLTYLLGLTKMPLNIFLVITLLARFPAILASTYGGNALVEKDYLQASVVFIIFTIISIIGYYQYMKYKNKIHH